MSLRHAFGAACLLALLVLVVALCLVILWYLLITSPPLGWAVIVFTLLLVGAMWGLE